MLKLLEYLQSIYPVNPETQALLATMLKEHVVLRGRHWLQEGTVCDRIAFIEKGLMRVYFESGARDVCLWYNKEMDVTVSVASFFLRQPSRFAIQAVEETTVFYITYQQLQEVYAKQAGFNVNGRRILEHYYSLSEMHVKLLLEPAYKRLDTVASLYPWMFTDHRITKKMLAAYIGITPEHLGRFERKKRMV